MLMPRKKTPELSVDLVGGGRFNLASEGSERGTVVCFYRGLHCPICATYLGELEKLTSDFAERGVGTVAVSSDDHDRAASMSDKINASDLRIGYGLALSDAKDWGLYVSAGIGKTSIGIEEPALFSEPGLFMVTPEQTLYYGSVQTMPFVRPHFSELVKALDFAIGKNYPARGEYTGWETCRRNDRRSSCADSKVSPCWQSLLPSPHVTTSLLNPGSEPCSQAR